MTIKRLNIKNFRGIKSLDWSINKQIVCLFGLGDSTKSTILDAIELVFSPRWNITFSDLDFYGARTNVPIEISATFIDLPLSFYKDNKFGFFINHWNAQEGVHGKEKEDDELSLTIQLVVNDSLEPRWEIVDLLNGESKPISAADREEIGVSQLGDYLDRDFSLSRISALSRLVSNQSKKEIAVLLANLSREALNSIDKDAFDSLQSIAGEIQNNAAQHGAQIKGKIEAGLDPVQTSFRSGGITLNDSGIPLRLAGMGTKRLTAIALNKMVSSAANVLLIDEIEAGLEPHRLRNLLRKLNSSPEQPCQIFITTHAEIPLVELNIDHLFVVRSEKGVTTVNNISSMEHDLQDVIRKSPEAFLGKSVVVCEGKTEWGVSRALETYWEEKFCPHLPLAYFGTVFIDLQGGGGSNASGFSMHLKKLGYRVCYLGDSDRVVSPTVENLRTEGVEVIVWDDELSLEERVCLDLPPAGLKALIESAVQVHGPDKIQKHLINSFKNVDETFSGDWSDETNRILLGKLIKDRKWFKEKSNGEALGNVIVTYYDDLKKRDTGIKLEKLRAWCYEQH